MTITVVQAKSVFTSTTFYGSLLSLLSVLDPTLYAHLLSSLGVNDSNLIVAKITGIIGFAVAVYGRWNAMQPLALKAGPKAVELKPKVTVIPPGGLR